MMDFEDTKERCNYVVGAMKNAIGFVINFEGAALRREGLVRMEYGRTVGDVGVRKTPVFCAKIAEMFILLRRLVCRLVFRIAL